MRGTILILLINLQIVYSQERFSLEGFVGGNTSYVRNDVLSGESPGFGIHLGISARLYLPKNPNVSLGLSLLHSQKGYQQNNFVQYNPTFYYTALQLLGYYKLNQLVTAYGGFEFSRLNDVNIVDGLETYQPHDKGIIAGIRFWDTRRFSLNTQFIYGLEPVLVYPRFDKFGNKTGEIRDLKNVCLSLGVCYKIISK